VRDGISSRTHHTYILYCISSRIVTAFFLAVFGPKAFVFVRKHRHCSVGARMFSYRRRHPHSFLCIYIYVFYIISPLFGGGRHISTPKLPLSRWDKKNTRPRIRSCVSVYKSPAPVKFIRPEADFWISRPLCGRNAETATRVHLFRQCTLHTHTHTRIIIVYETLRIDRDLMDRYYAVTRHASNRRDPRLRKFQIMIW